MTFLHRFVPEATFPSTLPSLSLLGASLGIFLGFRNNAAYDRYWEGRKLWGQLVNTSRTLARDIMLFVDVSDADTERHHERLVYRVVAFAHALRMQLREQAVMSELEQLLPEAEQDRIFSSKNVPNAIVLELGRHLRSLFRAQRFGENCWVELARLLGELSNIQGGCERIKNTPIPYSYTVVIHQVVAAYVLLLPFGLVTTFGFGTLILAPIVAYTFLGLEAVGDEIEEPFGEDMNDLPLDALCRIIEVNLREGLGEVALPSLSIPVDGVLL